MSRETRAATRGTLGATWHAHLTRGLCWRSDLTQARQVLETGQALDPSNRSFPTWLKKCGDAPPTNIGKHDEVLGALLSAHDQQGYALMETAVEFLSRKTSVLGLSAAPEMLASLAVKYSTSAAPAARQAPEAAAAGGQGARGGGATRNMVR